MIVNGKSPIITTKQSYSILGLDEKNQSSRPKAREYRYQILSDNRKDVESRLVRKEQLYSDITEYNIALKRNTFSDVSDLKRSKSMKNHSSLVRKTRVIGAVEESKKFLIKHTSVHNFYMIIEKQPDLIKRTRPAALVKIALLQKQMTIFDQTKSQARYSILDRTGDRNHNQAIYRRYMLGYRKSSSHIPDIEVDAKFMHDRKQRLACGFMNKDYIHA